MAARCDFAVKRKTAATSDLYGFARIPRSADQCQNMTAAKPTAIIAMKLAPSSQRGRLNWRMPTEMMPDRATTAKLAANEAQPSSTRRLPIADVRPGSATACRGDSYGFGSTLPD